MSLCTVVHIFIKLIILNHKFKLYQAYCIILYCVRTLYSIFWEELQGIFCGKKKPKVVKQNPKPKCCT